MSLSEKKGFNQVHIAEEKAARDRGLLPFRIRFSLALKNLKTPCKLRGNSVIVAFERKSQVVATQPKLSVTEDENNVSVDEIMQLFLVLGRRNGFGKDGLDDAQSPNSGLPLQGFETVVARVTVRKNDSSGPVIDCAALNLSSFVTGRHSTSGLDLRMQLGGCLSLTVDTRVFLEGDEMTDVENGELLEKVKFQRTACGSENQLVGGLDGKEETGGTCNNFEEQDMNLTLSHEDYGLERNTAGKDELNQDRLLSFCESESSGDSRQETGQGNRERTEEDEGSGPLLRMATSTIEAPVYETIYSGGVWQETPKISTMDTPNKLVFWHIEGPDESDDEEESDEEEEGGRRKKVHKHSRMVVTTTVPGRPAAPGKMSPLQKSCMRLQEYPEEPFFIRLDMEAFGGGMQSALQATKLMASEVQYIDEPEISDIEDDGRNWDKVLTGKKVSKGDGGMKGDEGINGDGGMRGDEGDAVIDEVEEEDEYIRDVGIRDRTGAGVVKAGYASTAESGSSESECEEDEGSEGEENQFRKNGSSEEVGREGREDELQFRMHKMEKYIREVQVELKNVLRESCELREENVRLTEEREVLAEQVGVSEGGVGKSSGDGEGSNNGNGFKSGNGELSIVQRELEIARQENERLLEVILDLKSELDREPGSPEVVRELMETKAELALEREKRGRLEVALGKKGRKKGIFGFGGGSGQKDGDGSGKNVEIKENRKKDLGLKDKT